MTNEKKRWHDNLPGILTGIAAVISAMATFYVAIDGKHDDESELEPQPRTKIEQQTNPSNTPSVLSNRNKPLNESLSPRNTLQPVNIGSIWRELYPNPGNRSETIQNGNTFRFKITGAIQGLRFQSSGSGTITGQHIESTYQSTIPSKGRCAGTASFDGMKMTLTCVDSVNGQYETAWVRE